MSHVVIFAGEGEYESYRTMKAIQNDLRENLTDLTIDYRVSDVLEDYPTFPASSFGELSTLREAQLLIVYTRFRVLPDAEMQELADFLQRGGGVIGVRTSTHAFKFPSGSPWQDWNDGFGGRVLGSPCVSHHGHSSSTDVSRVRGEDHPVLAGVPAAFSSRSWLYRVSLAPDCRPLLHGEPVGPESAPTPAPVAWVREVGGRRVFYTSLGHPDDFDDTPLPLLLRNATTWCLGR